MSGGDGEWPFVTFAGPAGTRFSEVRWFDEVDSTNRYLVDAAASGALGGLVAAAAHQRAGRGRLGRRWEAPSGANLLVSVLLCPDLPAAQLHLCTAAAAVAALGACKRLAGVEAELKWPNDLMVGPRKLAGVLAEVVGTAVVVGVGVNVRWPPPPGTSGMPAVPPELEHMVTSLWTLCGRRLEPRALLDLFLAEFEPLLVLLDSPAGRRHLASDYRARCSTIGQSVRVDLADESVVGEAADVTAEGHLIVSTGTCLRTIAAGDVVHLRDQG
jgi:BirA family transcriptional regulator, biotin operon repressor / biotin---[acetyl-CoA-carboxylase] ligase